MRGSINAQRAQNYGVSALISFLSFVLPAAGLCDEQKPLVLVSVAPQIYFVTEIAGDSVRVESLIPPAANPHSYEPAIAQLSLLKSASLFFTVGQGALPFEELWTGKAKGENPGLKIVPAGRECQVDAGEDPHIWLSFDCVERMAVSIAAALAEMIPAEKARFEEGRSRLRNKVAELREEIAGNLSGIKRKKFLVYHPAWGYFARQFGLEQVAIEMEGKEPDTRRLIDVLTWAREANVRTIFVEPQFPKESAEVVAKELNARIVPIDPQAVRWDEELRSFSKKLAEELKDK